MTGKTSASSLDQRASRRQRCSSCVLRLMLLAMAMEALLLVVLVLPLVLARLKSRAVTSLCTVVAARLQVSAREALSDCGSLEMMMRARCRSLKSWHLQQKWHQRVRHVLPLYVAAGGLVVGC